MLLHLSKKAFCRSQGALSLSIEASLPRLLQGERELFRAYLDDIQQLHNTQMAAKYFRYVPKLLDSRSLSPQDMDSLLEVLSSNRALERECRLGLAHLHSLLEHLGNQPQGDT